jgi:hypothetical protein
MNEHVQTEQATKAPPTLEEMKASFDRANFGGQAVMRSALALSTIIDSQLDRRIKIDAVMATLKSLVTDIEVGTYERLYKVREKAPNLPMEVIIAQAALLACDLSDGFGHKQANIMQLFIDEVEERIAAKERAEAVS